MKNYVVLMGLVRIHFFLCFYHFTFNLVQFSMHRRLVLHVQNGYFRNHICFSLEAAKQSESYPAIVKTWACFLFCLQVPHNLTEKAVSLMGH